MTDTVYCANDCVNFDCKHHRVHAPRPRKDAKLEPMAQTDKCPWSRMKEKAND
jgi:hypothetical protein